MIDKKFSIGKISNLVMDKYPSLRFRDKDVWVHNAGDAMKCSRQITYKALKTPESNPADMLGKFRMRFGSWLEKGIAYEILGKGALFGMVSLSSQGDTGEHGTFYGTSWHGYRDFDVAIKQLDSGKYKPCIVELKTKVGYGAVATIKTSGWSKEFKQPTPDVEWGQSQQLGLYLRDAYNKTKDHPTFSEPIVDGILLQMLYGDGVACFVEYYFEYQPKTDSIKHYRTHCEQYPELNCDADMVIPLKPIADRWRACDEYLKEGKLAPPDYERRWSVNDERFREATKKDLQLAIKDQLIIGDMHCKYCSFRDTCAKDLKIKLKYSPEEKTAIKKILAMR